jgi:MFS family permease
MMRLRSWFSPLKERNFRLFFIGQTASQIGSGMAPVAIVFAVLAHGSASDVGFVLTAGLVPLVLLLLVGGVVGDRMSRRTLMLQSDALRTVAECTLGIWILVGRPPLWGFMLLAALMGVGQAFFSPALTGILPQMLDERNLQQGNALNGISNSSGGIIGPAIAGIIVAVSNPGWAVLIDGFTYLMSVLSLWMIRIDWTASEKSDTFFVLLREGWRELWTRSWLWSIIVQSAFINALFASFVVLGPVVAKTSLGGARAWGAILAAEGAGAVVAGVIMLRLHPRRPLLAACLWSLFFPVPMFFIAARSPTIIIAITAFLAGGGVTVFGVQWHTTLQREIPSAILSRVSAYDWFGSLAFFPLGTAIVGPVSASIGITTTLVGSGILVMALILAAVAIPSVRQLRSPERN